MNTRTTVMGIFAVTISVALVAGWFFPTIGGIDMGHTETATYQNSGPCFAFTDDSGITHLISCTLDDGVYYVTTDGETARTMDMYSPPTTGIASAIGIGVYEAYNDNGVLTSKSGVTASTTQTVDGFRTLALAGNTDVEAGTYQLWNYYQYTLYKIMGLTVMGNTDSQYMMGDGVVSASNFIANGTTSSAYQKSTSKTTAECLFIENAWGNINEFIGDVYQNNRVLSAGNTLGGNALADVDSTLTQTITIPSSNGNVGKIYYISDAFGTPKVNGNGTAGNGFNDAYTQDTGYCTIGVGGRGTVNQSAGLFCYYANNPFDYSENRFTTRLAYVLTNEHDMADYGYKIVFEENGNVTTISDVLSQENGGWVSHMPDGTTMDSYWDFDPITGTGPFGAYYVAINLNSGSNPDDTHLNRYSTQKGEIAYRLNPYNLHQTMEGFAYSSSLYNIMLIVPTAYWYSDPDTHTLYIGSEPDRFENITMRAYAHEYTIDPDVDTGNPPKAVYYDSETIAVADGSIIVLYANGDVKHIRSSDTVLIGNASDTVGLSLTDNQMTYTGGTAENVELYAVATGDYVGSAHPYVASDTPIWIGGVHSTPEGTVGYEGKGTQGTLTVTALDPAIGYDTTELTLSKEILDTEAMKVKAEITTVWDGGTVIHQYNVMAPAEVTVEYSVPGLSDMEMKIVLSMCVIIVAGILVFCIRFL